MAISYEEALRAQHAIEDKLLEDPNVVSIGVIEEADDLGQKTGNYAIKVGVVSAKVYQNALNSGQSIIPQEYILHSEDNSQEIKYVHIKVVKTGRIKALLVSNEDEDRDLPSAVDDIPTVAQTLDDHTLRRRPSPCGHSIGHPSVTAGTIGLLLEYAIGSNAGKAYILSNNHVLAANNSGFVGDPITQPGRHDLGVVGKDTIASLHRWVPLNSQGVNYVDAAIAEVIGGLEWNKNVEPYVSKIGNPSHWVVAKLDMNVEKVGRTTGYTQGKVISIDQTVKIDYGTVVMTFKNQICTTSMSKGGDSGACLFEAGTKRPVGLLFAGDASESYHNPFGLALSSLSMPHINSYSSGKTHTFSADYPLRILMQKHLTPPLGSAYTNQSVVPSTPLSNFTQNTSSACMTHLKTSVRRLSKTATHSTLLAGCGIFAANKAAKQCHHLLNNPSAYFSL